MKMPKYFYYRVKVVNKGCGVEVEDASDVDVAEVVRCADCLYYSELIPGTIPVCLKHGKEFYPGDYCSKGVKRDV